MRASGLVRLFALLSASAVFLLCVPAVQAATVSMTVGANVDVTLTVEAAPGEANRVGVAMTTDMGGWIVSDTGSTASGPLTLTAGPGCTSLDPQIALCEHNLADITKTPVRIVLVLGDSANLGPGVGIAGDEAWASDACGPVRFDPLPCQTRIEGGEGRDIVFASDSGQRLVVGADPSTRSLVLGGPGNDTLRGGEAGSRLIGGLGDDNLIGGAGRDVITGGDGADTIRGGLARDELRGQVGADTFYTRGGFSDRVIGGRGHDSARVDRNDIVRSIERFF
jgi:RTX calcium-binding nonapeptide repeat (4 copies)